MNRPIIIIRMNHLLVVRLTTPKPAYLNSCKQDRGSRPHITCRRTYDSHEKHCDDRGEFDRPLGDAVW
jgi:hypothetical protein